MKTIIFIGTFLLQIKFCILKDSEKKNIVIDKLKKKIINQKIETITFNLNLLKNHNKKKESKKFNLFLFFQKNKQYVEYFTLGILILILLSFLIINIIRIINNYKKGLDQIKI